MIRAARVCVLAIIMMIAVAVVTSAQLQHAQYTLIPIVPDGMALDINNRGQVVGQHLVNQQVRAFLWWKGATTDLSMLPGGNFARAYGINDAGHAVGIGNTGSGTEDRAILWYQGRPIDLGTLPNGNRSEAVAINNRGEIVGMSTNESFAFRPVIWRDQVIDLGTLPGYEGGWAFDINERGDAVGFVFNQLGPRAVLWQEGAPVDLGTLPGDSGSVAFAINNRGQVVGVSVSSETGNERPFLWERGVMFELAAPAQPASAVDISNSGRIAGGFAVARAAVYAGGIFVPVDAGTTASLAAAINSRGDIVGTSGNVAALWRRND